MKAIIFDTETTDLTPGQICQLAYVVAGDGPARAVNYFFTVDSVSPSAQNVHGFSPETLRALSGGRRFGDSYADIDADFRSADVLIGHNLNFDTAFMSAEYARLKKRFTMRRGLCTMRYFTPYCALVGRSGRPKMPSLAELCHAFGVTAELAANMQMALFGSDSLAHDARYDCAATYLCAVHAMKENVLRELFTYDIA